VSATRTEHALGFSTRNVQSLVFSRRPVPLWGSVALDSFTHLNVVLFTDSILLVISSDLREMGHLDRIFLKENVYC
jgi:hypothetical protein